MGSVAKPIIDIIITKENIEISYRMKSKTNSLHNSIDILIILTKSIYPVLKARQINSNSNN